MPASDTQGVTLYKHQQAAIVFEDIEKELGQVLFIKPCNMKNQRGREQGDQPGRIFRGGSGSL